MRRVAAFAVSAALLTGFASASSAQPDPYGRRSQDEARAGVQERRIVPLQQIIQQISRRSPGQLLGADGPSAGGDGRLVYRVLWDSRGRQIEYIVDARSGQILSVNGE